MYTENVFCPLWMNHRGRTCPVSSSIVNVLKFGMTSVHTAVAGPQSLGMERRRGNCEYPLRVFGFTEFLGTFHV